MVGSVCVVGLCVICAAGAVCASVVLAAVVVGVVAGVVGVGKAGGGFGHVIAGPITSDKQPAIWDFVQPYNIAT